MTVDEIFSSINRIFRKLVSSALLAATPYTTGWVVSTANGNLGSNSVGATGNYTFKIDIPNGYTKIIEVLSPICITSNSISITNITFDDATITIYIKRIKSDNLNSADTVSFEMGITFI